jgi:DNA (cytosine-5)-methyltransferase 1
VTLRYLSVCSGVEAATVAWHHMGWIPVGFAEIEPFPSAVLRHHYPDVPNFGDMTRYKEWPDVRPDVIVGGTPCQSFSVAGLRKGMADPRGNLALVFLGLVDHYRPRWVVWENVPGVLSSSGGRDFGAFLGGLGELGYQFAYRCLDAQYFGVAQRRNRVFVVAHLGDWRPPAAVLFEPESLSGHPSPRRSAGEEVTHTLASRTRSGGGGGGGPETETPVIPTGQWWDGSDTAQALKTTGHLQRMPDKGHLDAIIAPTVTSKWAKGSGGPAGSETGNLTVWPAEVAPTMNAHYGDKQGLEDQHALGGAGMFVPLPMGDDVAGTLTANGPDSNGAPNVDGGHYVAVVDPAKPGEDRTVAVDLQQITSAVNRSQPRPESPPLTTNSQVVAFGWQHSAHQGLSESEAVTPTLDKSKTPAVMAFTTNDHGADATEDLSPTVRAGGTYGANGGVSPSVAVPSMAVRRLTPRECERLQGFPDDYTLVPYRGKPASDGPRYKAMGNSMAVPVMRWIGERIAEVDAMLATLEERNDGAS